MAINVKEKHEISYVGLYEDEDTCVNSAQNYTNGTRKGCQVWTNPYYTGSSSTLTFFISGVFTAFHERLTFSSSTSSSNFSPGALQLAMLTFSFMVHPAFLFHRYGLAQPEHLILSVSHLLFKRGFQNVKPFF